MPIIFPFLGQNYSDDFSRDFLHSFGLIYMKKKKDGTLSEKPYQPLICDAVQIA